MLCKASAPSDVCVLHCAVQALFVDGHFAFKGLALVAQYGVDYTIHFSPFPWNLWAHIQNATSDPIKARPCGASEFYVQGRTACTVCGAFSDIFFIETLSRTAVGWLEMSHWPPIDAK